MGRSPAHPPEVLQGLMEFLVKPVLRVLSDPVEKCRELAVGLLSEYVHIVLVVYTLNIPSYAA